MHTASKLQNIMFIDVRTRGRLKNQNTFSAVLIACAFFLSVHSIDTNTTYERVPTYNSIQQIIQTILFDSTIRNNNTLYNFTHYSYCTTININYHHIISSKTTNSLETYQTKTVLLMMMKFSMVQFFQSISLTLSVYLYLILCLLCDCVMMSLVLVEEI